MRNSLLAALSCAALATAVAAPAVAFPSVSPSLRLADTEAFSDAELRLFASAMEIVQPIAAAANGGALSPDQQAAMAAAVQASGLDVERFNAISMAVASDGVLRARAELVATDPSPAGSVAAAVTDVEVEKFALAMAEVRPIAESLNGAAPNAEQQAGMAAAIEASGLELDRFNTISRAVPQDAYLRARLRLADARRDS